MSVTCTPYTDCTTKEDSLESIFRQLLVVKDDGSLALRVCCCDVYTGQQE